MYVEDLLALNFMMNTALLYLTARLTGRNVTKKRVFAGGFAAACYSLAVYLPVSVIIFSWAGKITVSILVVLLTFSPRRVVETLRLCGAFFLSSFIVGGTIFALYNFLGTQTFVKGGVFYFEPPRPGMLFFGVLIAFLLLLAVWHYGERRRRSRHYRFRVTIFDETREVTAQGFVDTGNQLRDPVTNRPLCVASYHVLKKLLPEKIQAAYETGKDPVCMLDELDSAHATKFGVVPFRSLQNSGMLLTYRPARVVLEGTDYREERRDLLFALTTKSLSLDNDAEVLLHPFVIETTGGVDC